MIPLPSLFSREATQSLLDPAEPTSDKKVNANQGPISRLAPRFEGELFISQERL